MTDSTTFRPTDRLLVWAPHPDDETLATGALIQSALAAGAAVHVVFATNGDNNPWPQRWIEKRWNLGSHARQRWGERRRGEAQAALAILGVEQSCVRFLGWPDLGLTDLLMRDDVAQGQLRGEINAFAPSHIALPTLTDCHPDHSALRVLLELALAQSQFHDCIRLGFVVHGPRSTASGAALDAPAAIAKRKLDALDCYASQLSLSRKRLIGWASQPEWFEGASRGTPVAARTQDLVLSVPPPRGLARLRKHRLLLVLVDAHRTRRLSIDLSRAGDVSLGSDVAHVQHARIEKSASMLCVTLPKAALDGVHGYAKLERTWPRLFIFDRQGWQGLNQEGADESAGTTQQGIIGHAVT